MQPDSNLSDSASSASLDIQISQLSIKDEQRAKESVPERHTEALPETMSAPMVEELESETGAIMPPDVSLASIILQCVKQLVSSGVTSDLHKVSVPAIVMNGLSLLEYSVHWAEYPRLLADISIKSTPLGILIFYDLSHWLPNWQFTFSFCRANGGCREMVYQYEARLVRLKN